MDATDTLTAAVAAWVTAVLPHLGPDQYKAWESMLAGQCDARVVVRLRQGTVCLDAVDDRAYMELYRTHVAPLRPADGFGHDDGSGVRQ
jgi:hypothetical protein